MAHILRSKHRKNAIRSVVIFHNERKPEARRALSAVRKRLKKARIAAHLAGCRDFRKHVRAADMAIAIGGDGTMLRAGRILASATAPLLGINVGGLGYLSAVDPKGFQKDFKRIVSGRFEVEQRYMLSVEVRRKGKRLFGPHVVLNDCVVRAGDQVRAVLLEVESRRQRVADYFGDGLILATPTGSTAYALSVGGPVIVPGVDALLLAPICPHALTSRPLITSSSDPVTVRLKRKNPYDRPQALISLDGQLERPLQVGDEVNVRRYDRPFRLLVPPERSYFDVLRQKLKWGGTVA